MQYSYLFDTNIYRYLTSSQGGEAIINFNNSIENNALLRNVASTKVNYKMTPFTVMEALGITIQDPKIKLPENFLKKGKHWEIIYYLSQQAKNYFASLPQTKKEYFHQKAAEQSTYTSTLAKGFASILISGPISDPNFEDNLNKCLLFDYLYKYEYPKEFEMEIFDKFLMYAIFDTHSLSAGVSKFRIIRRIWNCIYPVLYVEGEYSKDLLEDISKSMKLKREEDYLDCELVHVVCFGDYINNTYNPTVVFTCDNARTVINRVKVYKSMVDLFFKFFKEKVYQDYREILKNWMQGILIFCNKDGTFKETVEVQTIAPLIRMQS